MRCESPVDWERDSDHEARPEAARPEDGRGNLLRSAEAADRLIPHYVLHLPRPASGASCLSSTPERDRHWTRAAG